MTQLLLFYNVIYLISLQHVTIIVIRTLIHFNEKCIENLVCTHINATPVYNNN